MKKILFILIFFMGILGESSAQMNLFKGSFEEALKRHERKRNHFLSIFMQIGVVPVRQWQPRYFPKKKWGIILTPVSSVYR